MGEPGISGELIYPSLSNWWLFIRRNYARICRVAELRHKNCPNEYAATEKTNLSVVSVEKGCAALGAAVAGVKAYCDHIGESFDVENFSKAVLKRGELINPNATDVTAYHGERNYLQRFRETYERILKENPL